MKPEVVSRKTETGLGFWLIATLVAVSAHAFWLWGMEWGAPQTAAEAPSVARWTLQFWDDTQLPDVVQDQLAVSSPTLFALPGPVGFSQAWLEDEIAVRPPVDQPPEITMQLARQRPADEQRVAPLPARGELLAAVAGQPLPIPRPAAQAISDDEWPSPVPRLLELRGADTRAAEALDWPSGVTQWGSEGWQATGMITIDRSGTVTHVVLDQRPDEREVADRLVHTLHGWRWRPAQERTMVHFVASYPGAPRGPTMEEENER